MDRHALTAFVASITARLWQRSPNSTAGSAASSVTLGEVADCSPDEALQRLGSSANGLTTEEAEARLRSVGPNEVAHEVRHTIVGEIISRSMNPLNLLLLTLAAASYFLGDQRAAVVIAVMVLLSVSLGFFQEHRSNKAAARAARDGADQRDRAPAGWRDRATSAKCRSRSSSPATSCMLSAGDMIPADVRLLSAKDLFVNQSALTGEAMPVEKNAAAPRRPAAATPFDLPNICFMGSNVRERRGCRRRRAHRRARPISASWRRRLPSGACLTSFDKGVTRFTWLMIRFIAVMVPARLPDQRPDQGRLARGAAVRGGRGGRADARDAADDRDGQSGQGRDGDVAARRSSSSASMRSRTSARWTCCAPTRPAR